MGLFEINLVASDSVQIRVRISDGHVTLYCEIFKNIYVFLFYLEMFKNKNYSCEYNSTFIFSSFYIKDEFYNGDLSRRYRFN